MTNAIRYLLYFIPILVLTGAGGDNNVQQKLIRQLSLYRQAVSPEQVHLLTDRSVYRAGDSVRFSAYVEDMEYFSPTEKSQSLYVYLLNNKHEAVAGGTYFIRNGRATGCIATGADMPQGGASIVAFTARQQNFKAEHIAWQSLWIAGEEAGNSEPAPAFGATFVPGSGKLIAGIPTNVQVMMTAPEVLCTYSAVDVVDDKGRIAARFTPDGTNIQEFTFTPYAAAFKALFKDRNGNVMPAALPEVHQSGANIRVEEFKEDYIRLIVQFSDLSLSKGAMLSGIAANKLVLHQQVKEGLQSVYRLPLGSIMSDSMHLGVFGEDGSILTCQSVPMPGRDAVLTLNNIASGKEDELLLEIGLSDDDGEVLKGDFTVSVVAESLARQSHLEKRNAIVAGNDRHYWKGLLSTITLPGKEADRETHRLKLVKRNGKPLAEKEIWIGEGDSRQPLYTDEEGYFTLPNKMLADHASGLKLELPDSKCKVEVENGPSPEFMEQVRSLAGYHEEKPTITGDLTTWLKEPVQPHTGNAAPYSWSEADEAWYIRKYEETDHLTYTYYRSDTEAPAIYWQPQLKVKGFRRLSIPLGSYRSDLVVRLQGFTEDGVFISRTMTVTP